MADLTGDRLFINYPTTPYTGPLVDVQLNGSLKARIDQDGQLVILNGGGVKLFATKDGDLYASRFVIADGALAVGGGFGGQGLTIDGDGLLQTDAALAVNQPAAFNAYSLAQFSKDGTVRFQVKGNGDVVMSGRVGIGGDPVSPFDVRESGVSRLRVTGDGGVDLDIDGSTDGPFRVQSAWPNAANFEFRDGGLTVSFDGAPKVSISPDGTLSAQKFALSGTATLQAQTTVGTLS